jgi:hypothetical protein
MTEQIVAVRYRDIGCDQTEMYTAEELLHRKGVEFVIFGMLRVNTEEKVVIAQERCENGNYRGATTILRPLVQEVVPIAQWPLKKKRQRSGAGSAPGAAASPAPPLTTSPAPTSGGSPAPPAPRSPSAEPNATQKAVP